MGRLIVAVLIVGLIVLGIVIVASGLRAAARGTQSGRGLDLAERGMVPKLAYGLLIALIVYATLTADGA